MTWNPVDAVQLRAGRLGLDIYPLSDSRNVGYSNLSYAEIRMKREYNTVIEQLLNTLRDPALAAFSPGAAALADELSIKDRHTQFQSLVALYEQKPFQAQVGLSRIHSNSLMLPDVVMGFALLGRRWAAWSPYLGFSKSRSPLRERTTGLPLSRPSTAWRKASSRFWN